MDIFIILQLSANNFHVTTTGGKQQTQESQADQIFNMMPNRLYF